jgi:hypothetical protein
MTDVVVKDNFGAELDYVPDSVKCSQGTYEFMYKNGRSKKMYMTWNVGDLAPGEVATLEVIICTKPNPAGKQEYTSPGIYYLNSGATVKWRDARDKQHSYSTSQIKIEAVAQICGYVKDQYGDPVVGAKLELYDPNGKLAGTATTDNTGFYQFTDELTKTGIYTIRIVWLPGGYSGVGTEETIHYKPGQKEPSEKGIYVNKI